MAVQQWPDWMQKNIMSPRMLLNDFYIVQVLTHHEDSPRLLVIFEELWPNLANNSRRELLIMCNVIEQMIKNKPVCRRMVENAEILIQRLDLIFPFESKKSEGENFDVIRGALVDIYNDLYFKQDFGFYEPA